MRALILWALALLIAIAPGQARAEDGALKIGSKRFTESFLVAEIAAAVAEAAGERVTLREGLGGTSIVFRALEEGSIDLYPEYTGTLKETILNGAPGDLAALRRALLPRGIGVSDPLGFENTYAIVVPRRLAEEKGLRRISDLAAHPELRIALSHEFLGRPDGWPGLAARYGLHAKVEGMDHGLAYEALAAGRVDAVDAYSTDAKLKKYDLVALQDDKRFFPSYEAVFLYRLDVPQRFPRGWAALSKLAGSIDQKTMIDLNSEVELDGKPFAEVARAYVAHIHDGTSTARDANGPRAPAASELQRLAASIARHGPRHLFLVGVSLALSTVAGVLLGILANRSRKWRVPILSTVALVQTVPSLALLCFMIPVFGIGVVPTLAALFLYGLLPIVRNTFAGLAEIPPNLREASAALGLSPLARLVSIELPLASRLILAGIKTSAILAVGTATVAAFIGAGGFGEPIAVGLNLNDTRTILDGAIPAALLALAVEAAFAGIERLIVPRGLRLGARAHS